MELPQRKNVRLKGHDCSSAGVYFITLCTKDRRCILSYVVGTGLPDGPQMQLTEYGKVADKYIRQLNDYYDNISVDRYVIMPNHIHLLIRILPKDNGPSGTPVPTRCSVLSQFISTFKRFCNKEYGYNIWQDRSYDHIVRDKEDYLAILKYIHENPVKWYFDELYNE